MQRTAALVSDTILTSGDAATQRHLTAGAAPWAKDDLHSIALSADRVHLSWARGGGIDVAAAAPR